jgi:hypothetical protein
MRYTVARCTFLEQPHIFPLHVVAACATYATERKTTHLMKLKNGTNVRMDQQTHDRVCSIARRYRIKKADIIRNALYEALPKWERDGVKLVSAEPAQ